MPLRIGFHEKMQPSSWNPLLVAVIATIAWSLHVTGGSLCSFVDVSVLLEGEILAVVQGADQSAVTQTTIGVGCTGGFYTVDGDLMWKLSRIFWGVSVAFGGVSVVMGWLVSICLFPNERRWRIISVFAALSAILEIPMFLILESYPCSDFEDIQSCKLSTSAYFTMASVAAWIVLTFVTQLLDPPSWVDDTWLAPAKRSESGSLFGRFRQANGSRVSEDRIPILPLNATETLSEELNTSPRPIQKTPTFSDQPHSSRSLAENFSSAVPQPVLNEEDLGWNAAPTYREDAISAATPEQMEEAMLAPRPHQSEEHDSIFQFPQVDGNESILDIAPEHPQNHGFVLREADDLPHIVNEKQLQRAPPVSNQMEALAVQYGEKANPEQIEPSKKGARSGMLGGIFKKQKQNAYAMMDDDDSFTSMPLSSPPPVEVLTFDDFNSSFPDTGENTDDDDMLDPGDPKNMLLMADWDALHNQQNQPDMVQFPVKQASSGKGLNTNSFDSGGSDVSPLEAPIVDNEGFLLVDTMQENDPRAKIEQIARLRELKRKYKGATSVCSSPSLLDTVIAEETAEEVENEDGDNDATTKRMMKSLSAPNLAGFASAEKHSNVAEDLHSVRGMNAYHRVEMYRSENAKTEEESTPPESPAKPPVAPKTASSGWKEEHDRRKGIHTIDVDDDKKVDAADVRDARIRRMKNPSLSDSRQRSRTLEPPKNRLRLPHELTSADFSVPAERSVRSLSPSPTRMHATPILQDGVDEWLSSIDKTETKGRSELPRVVTPPHHGHEDDDMDSLLQGSVDLNFDENYILDSLDVGLAELHRPYNAEYGPEERSV